MTHIFFPIVQVREWLATLDPDAKVTLDLNEDTKVLTISCGESSLVFEDQDPAHYRAWPPEFSVTVHKDTLKKLLKKVKPAAMLFQREGSARERKKALLDQARLKRDQEVEALWASHKAIRTEFKRSQGSRHKDPECKSARAALRDKQSEERHALQDKHKEIIRGIQSSSCKKRMDLAKLEVINGDTLRLSAANSKFSIVTTARPRGAPEDVVEAAANEPWEDSEN